MAREVLTVLRERLAARPDKPAITFVGHSLGSMLIVRMFGDDALRRDFADVFARADSAVLFAPPDGAGVRSDGVLRDVAESSEFELELAGKLGILRDRIAQANLESAADPHLVTREEVDRVVRVLGDPCRLRV